MSWLDTIGRDKVDVALDALRKQRDEGHHGVKACLDYANGDERFALWLRLVNAAVTRKAGVSLFDLADVTLRDWFDDGYTPNDAAREALSSDDLYGSFE